MTDATSPEFWNERYRTGETPWDYEGVPPELADYLSELPSRQRILIPGCGSARDLNAALDNGHDAVGIDLSHEAVERARKHLGIETDRLIRGDFFAYPFTEGTFDVIYERTFLCALPGNLRESYVDRMHALLKAGGCLAGFFVFGEEPDPPPYPLAPGEQEELFNPRFELVVSRQSRSPLPFFEGMEWWQVWEKR